VRSWSWALLAVALTGCGASAASEPAPRQTATASTTASPTVQSVVRMPSCTGPLYRPDEVVIACGDGNARIKRLQWTTWSVTSATGTGVWEQNDCRPDCARGRFHPYAVRLVVSNPAGKASELLFGDVVATFPGEAPPASAYASHRVVLYRDGRPVV
jgi:hypothetical protein